MDGVEIRSAEVCDGKDLRDMFAAGTAWLERNAAAVNALNVFPVPDGDTGINMLLTMKATMEAASQVAEPSATAMAHAMAYGSLMGARGNSGVILSQILRGLARALDNKERFNGLELAAALEEASRTAYRGVTKPVEGTILTVIREAAAAAKVSASQDGKSIAETLESTVAAARSAVARTPTMLAILRDAGVVDAGGQGLLIILEGALSYLKGEVAPEALYSTAEPVSPPHRAAPSPLATDEERVWGYCTEFLIQGRNLSVDEIREKVAAMGDSTLVVGDETTVRMHLHTFDPGAAMSYATSLGVVRQVKVENMDEQHQEYVAQTRQAPPVGEVSVVAVVSGDGLAEVFKSLGAAAIVPGGQTSNPSTEELLQALESVPTDKVILLPNHPNVVMVAEQSIALCSKEGVVVPTHSIPQGIAALLAFKYDADLNLNVEAMKAAYPAVRTAELTRAVRSVELAGIAIAEGQPFALIDRKEVVRGETVPEVLVNAVTKMGLTEGSLVTLYCGEDISGQEAEEAAAVLRDAFLGTEVEVVMGGQPHYYYIVSVE